MKLAADIISIIGALFCFVAAIGLVRMPDVYNRIQAGTKAATLGILCLLLGIAIEHPDWWSKLTVIALFVLLTNPIGSSTLARAFYRRGVPLWRREAAEP